MYIHYIKVPSSLQNKVTLRVLLAYWGEQTLYARGHRNASTVSKYYNGHHGLANVNALNYDTSGEGKLQVSCVLLVQNLSAS
jgi:hypothetical protein